MRPVSAPALCGLALIALAACFGSDKKEFSDGGVNVAFNDSTAREPAMGPGDVKITSTEGALVISVIGDTVRMHLSDSLRNSVSQKVDSSTGDKSGISGMIARTVSSAVEGAMGFVVRVHVDEIQNLRYEDGHVRFDINGSDSKVNMSGSGKDNSKFSEEDAKRLIEAIEKRKAKKTAM